MSAIQKVELVSPAPAPHKAWRLLLQLLFGLMLRVLIVFWFFASWYPELGLTVWQLILPVYISMWIFRGVTSRQISDKYLRRSYWLNSKGDRVEHVEEVTVKAKEEK